MLSAKFQRLPPYFRPSCQFDYNIVDIDRHPRQPENKMAAFKPEVHCISGWHEIKRNLYGFPTISTMPDSDMPRLTWSTSATSGTENAAKITGSGNTRVERGMNLSCHITVNENELSSNFVLILCYFVLPLPELPLRNLSSDLAKSSVAVSRCHRKCGGRRWDRVAISFRSKVISTSGLCRRHFVFLMSPDVTSFVSIISNRAWSKIGNRLNRVAISFRSKVISIQVFRPTILNSGSRHRRGPCSMLGLSRPWPEANTRCIARIALHGIIELRAFFTLHMLFKFHFVTWYEIKKCGQLRNMDNCIPRNMF